MLRRLKVSEKGSITVLVLTTMLVVVGAVFTYYFSAMNKNASQEREIDEIKEEYDDTSSMDQIYEDTLNGQYFTSTKTIDGKSVGTYSNPTIPKGFKPIDTDTSKWGDGSAAPLIQDVNNGLVIEDREGNQFVWIPVEEPVAESTTAANTNKAMAIENGSNYKAILYNFNQLESTVNNTYSEPQVVSYYDRKIFL